MDLLTGYMFLLTIVLHVITKSSAVRCYMCSFSPEDRNNRTDKCTDDNFQPHNVYSDECPLGCEAFVQYDANEVLEHWRRNCVQEGQTITGDCKTNKILGWKQIRCTCDKDLCNMAPDRWQSALLPLLWLAPPLSAFWTATA